MPSLSPIRSLAELCTVRAQTHADRPAVDDGETVLTYAGLLEQAGRCAARLAARGVGPGDRVMLVARNSTPWVVAAFGVVLLGGTLVPLGHGSTPAERRRALARLEVGLVVVDDESGWEEPGDVHLLRLDEVAGREAGSTQENTRHTLPAPVPGGAEAWVLPTSGTTGAVKYVPMSHGQLTRLYAETSRRVGLREDDRILGVVPLAHSFGLNGVLLISMFAGARVLLRPRYEREQMADVVRSHGITVMAGPPTIYHDLATDGGRGAGAGVRLAITGSTEVQAERIRADCDQLGIPEIVVGYGMTETCGTVALEHLPAQPDAAGPALAVVEGVAVRTVGPDGHDTAPGVSGRLMVRGYNVLREYAGDGGTRPASDGWFDTGDVGNLDAEGRLSVVARVKDTVIVSGFNVIPHEVERVLVAHPGVERAVVVGVSDARQGQRLVACVVASPGVEPDTTSLRAHARDHLSGYKVPRDFVLVDSLPTTGTGKVSRAAVRRALESGTAPDG